ncbi:MAG TPA: ribonuclease III [Terriglobia bacterium]|jgi:ribonuclease-3
MPEESWKGLEKTIGYRFDQPDLLLQALTHRSHPEGAANERMEFLGDSILGFLVSEALVDRFPEFREGQLSKLKARLVSAAHLHPVAERLELGRYLRLGKAEDQRGDRSNRALVVDTLEALVAALYRDGGLAPTRRFVEQWILDSVDWQQVPTVDYKTELQEWLQQRHSPPPRYIVVREQGPEHRKIFTVELRVAGERIAQGEGASKKAAEQVAAQIALSHLREHLIESGNPKDR